MDRLLLFTILALIIVILLLGVSFLMVFARIMGVDLTLPSRRQKDNDVPPTDNGVPLTTFKPDFNKPLKVTYTEEEQMDKITPI